MNGREVVQIEISINIPSDEYNVLSFKCVEVLNPWASFTLYFGDSDLQTDKHIVVSVIDVLLTKFFCFLFFCFWPQPSGAGLRDRFLDCRSGCTLIYPRWDVHGSRKIGIGQCVCHVQ